MKWVTRARPKVDRVACPWLIRRFVDPAAEFLYVPPEQVMEVARREGAVPYDVPGVELGHHGDECSFDAVIRRYGLDDPGLARLAVIVRGADTDRKDLAPESRGLEAIAEGFRLVYADDHALLAHELPVYDALYAYCRRQVPMVLFVCPHGAAKSVIAAAYFERLARRRGLGLRGEPAGTDPDAAVMPGVRSRLAEEGVYLDAARAPRPVAPDDLAAARRVVSLGCDPERLAGAAAIERWDDLPPVSEDFARARDAIVRRVAALVDELARD